MPKSPSDVVHQEYKKVVTKLNPSDINTCKLIILEYSTRHKTGIKKQGLYPAIFSDWTLAKMFVRVTPRGYPYNPSMKFHFFSKQYGVIKIYRGGTWVL